ncbi:quinolinate synthase [Candidatus Roizmanbacteria bacterium CG23_combo_of_CG06-09_8_20_14_all_35_49]|uniref:Quinolinate synthase n=1 Tax=Candidatus Roizmanbacteria bacterium CG23_combo_of_CG06-09_8_20_14_all_35_49 TaxID=1974863 RepID=A0A2G9Y965_9BACT|nr:MAG: quinolinate synthase [Candidatus Roizmanbacteria bacterium CG23_combo_of_CG06-09_8_20_14_all_35_49]
MELIKEINLWRQKRHALILAHNYQIPEIQDLADFVGDSLELSQKAAKTKSELIVFCGVHFMAETAAILSPGKKVLIPDLNAGCSLANSITTRQLRRWKKRYPKAIVVSYVNTSAEVKAESDYCCTSTNAVKIVNSLPKNQQVLFTPDIFLGDYVARVTGRKNMIVYPGQCHVHAQVRPIDIMNKLKEYPQAEFLIHPECGCVTNCMQYVASGDLPKDKTHILSTGGMIKYCRTSPAKQFVIATETGIIYRLQKDNPDKKFIPVRDGMICQYMKMITLEKLLNSLKNLEYEVKVPEKIAQKARIPIQRMLELSK